MKCLSDLDKKNESLSTLATRIVTMESVYSEILRRSQDGEKQLAVLIDPDGLDMGHVDYLISLAQKAKLDYFFVGGSLIADDVMDKTIRRIKSECDIPCIIFPGSYYQLSAEADAILFLSLISGRNPEMLIGQQVVAAPYIKKLNLEVVATGYMNIDGGRPTTASYISNSSPIPRNKPLIAASTALAGEMLGHKVIFLDAGSGAKYPVSADIIAAVNAVVDIPIIVGGGVRTIEDLKSAYRAGADIVVIGDAIEKEPDRLVEFSDFIHRTEF